MRANLRATAVLELIIVALLVSDRVAAQASPDFSGAWILESAAPPSGDISKVLVVRQTISRVNVRGEPMQPFFRDLTVTRVLASGTHTETYVIGALGGMVSGRAGLSHSHSHQRVRWEGRALVLESGTYTGPDPHTGDWTERREVWSLAPDGRLQVALNSSDSRGDSSQVTLTYRRR